jgi:hypothetical protein
MTGRHTCFVGSSKWTASLRWGFRDYGKEIGLDIAMVCTRGHTYALPSFGQNTNTCLTANTM